MSSTMRGGQREPSDFYATPDFCVHRLLDALSERGLLARIGLKWLEPCAGDGAIVRAVQSWNSVPLLDWTAVELRAECRAVLENRGLDPIIADFFDPELVQRRAGWIGKFDVCLTNPPFALAMEFIAACRPLATHSLFLERLNFVGSEGRSAFFRDTHPDLYILPNRPSFASKVACKACAFSTMVPPGTPVARTCPACGKEAIRVTAATDSIEYMWIHFWPGASGRYFILDSTPIEARR